MNLRHLGYRVALAQERKFHKAALASHTTQPTLSSALRQLEAELGVPLVQAPRPAKGARAAARGSCVSGKRDDA